MVLARITMDQRNQGQDHVGTSTGVGALPSAQNIGLNGNVPVFDQDLLQTTNSDAMAAMMGAQPFIQDHSLRGDTTLPVDDVSYLMPMMMANGGPIGIPPNTVSAGMCFSPLFHSSNAIHRHLASLHHFLTGQTQMMLRSTTDKFDSGAWRPNKRYKMLIFSSSPCVVSPTK